MSDINDICDRVFFMDELEPRYSKARLGHFEQMMLLAIPENSRWVVSIKDPGA